MTARLFVIAAFLTAFGLIINAYPFTDERELTNEQLLNTRLQAVLQSLVKDEQEKDLPMGLSQGNVQYLITGILKFTETTDESDGNNHYEPYGYLKIKIDNFGYTLTVWDLENRENHGSLPKGDIYSVPISIPFSESSDFATSGEITLLGNVKEADKNPSSDDYIGKYNGVVVRSSEIYEKKWSRKFPGTFSTSYTVIELTMTKIG